MSKGKFGVHGGQFVPETLMNAVNEFEEAYNKFNDYLKAKQMAKAKNNETNVDEM